MKPIPWMAATAALGIVVGFLAGRNSRGPAPADGSGEKEKPSRSASGGGGSRDRSSRSPSSGDELLAKFTNGRSIQSLTATDVAEIIRANVNTDPNEDPLAAARRNFQLQLLLSKLPVALLGEVTKEVMEDSKLRASEGYKIFGVWANRDWKAALAWADNAPENSRWVGQALSALSATDPGLAAQMLSERTMSGQLSESYSPTYGIGRSYARLGKDALMQFVEGLPAGQQSNVLVNAIRDVPEGELMSLVETLHERKIGGGMQDYVFTSALSQLMRTNPEKAQAWLDKMPAGDEKTKLEVSVASNLAGNGKPVEAVAILKKAMEGAPGKEKEYLRQAINNGYSAGPDWYSKIADALPPGVEMTAADYGESGNLSSGGGQNFINLATTIRNPEEKVKYLTKVLDKSAENLDRSNYGRGFNEVDFKIVETRLASLDLTETQGQAVSASLQKLREAMNAKVPKE